MRIEEQVEVKADRPTVFAYVSDPAHYVDFMEGITRWEVDGDLVTGLGARYHVRMQVGTAYVGGLVEVVEFEPDKELAWTSVTGVDQRGRWRLRGRSPAVTDVTFRLSFSVPGGLLSRLTERVAGRSVARNVRGSLVNMKDAIERTS